MRLLRRFFSVLGLVVGLPLGGLLLYWTIAIKTVAQWTRPTPQRVPAAQLVQKGAPENLYVELTDFSFGKPVIEKKKDGGSWAWLPIEPNPAPAEAAKYTVFLRVSVPDQAALTALVKQARCAALVTTALPKASPWRVKCTRALQQANPDLDFRQVLFLSEPQLTLFGETIELSDPRLYDPLYESLAMWGGAVLVVFGFGSLYLMLRRGRVQAPAYVGPDAEAQRGQLQTERAESHHMARTGGVLQRLAWHGILAALLVGGIFMLAVAAFMAQGKDKPREAVMLTLLNLVVFLCARAAVRTSLRMFRWPTDIYLCPSGIRWQQGRKHRAILWAEIAEVRRDIKVIPRVTRTGLIGAYQQLNNPEPPIIVDTLLITLQSGESYRMSPDVVTSYNTFAESMKKLWKDDGLNRDQASFTDEWLKARRINVNS